MMSNEIINMGKTHNNEVMLYDPKVDLVEIRMNPQRFPRIKDIPYEQAVAQMREIVLAAYMYRNQTTDEDTLNFTAAALVEELQDENTYGTRNLSMTEISRAIKKGVLGMGKEMFGISVASLFQSVIDFIIKEGKPAEEKAYRLLQAKQGQREIPQNVLDAAAGALVSAIKGRTKQ